MKNRSILLGVAFIAVSSIAQTAMPVTPNLFTKLIVTTALGVEKVWQESLHLTKNSFQTAINNPWAIATAFCAYKTYTSFRDEKSKKEKTAWAFGTLATGYLTLLCKTIHDSRYASGARNITNFFSIK